MLSGFVRPKPIPFIMSIGGIALMLGLGIWQLQRLAWKEDLIARIEHANIAQPLTTLPQTLEAAQDKQFYRVTLSGKYKPKLEFHLAARYYQNQLGYAVFNPFVTSDGEMILVNRGWIPAKTKDTDAYARAPKGKQIITATIRTTDERNDFTPENQPDKNIWFGRDMVKMGEYAKLDVLPYSLDVVGEQIKDQYPVPSDGAIKLRNDHLNYAITWFLIALGMLVITLIYHRKAKAN